MNINPRYRSFTMSTISLKKKLSQNKYIKSKLGRPFQLKAQQKAASTLQSVGIPVDKLWGPWHWWGSDWFCIFRSPWLIRSQTFVWYCLYVLIYWTILLYIHIHSILNHTHTIHSTYIYLFYSNYITIGQVLPRVPLNITASSQLGLQHQPFFVRRRHGQTHQESGHHRKVRHTWRGYIFH